MAEQQKNEKAERKFKVLAAVRRISEQPYPAGEILTEQQIKAEGLSVELLVQRKHIGDVNANVEEAMPRPQTPPMRRPDNVSSLAK